jgi:hypothetical protein
VTATASARPVRVIDLEDTVTINRNPIGEATQRLFPIARDTEARVTDTARDSFAVLSPSGEQPLVGITPDQTAVLDALDRRFARFPGGDVDVRPGRHRAPEPGLFARLFGRGRKGGA